MNMAPQDHDLLIRVDENVKELKTIINTTFKDHEGRLRVVENDLSQARGAILFTKVLNGVVITVATIATALAWFK